MYVVILSVAFSAATTFVIAARVRREILDYVEEVCDINVEQVQKIKDITFSTIEEVVNRSKNE